MSNRKLVLKSLAYFPRRAEFSREQVMAEANIRFGLDELGEMDGALGFEGDPMSDLFEAFEYEMQRGSC